MITGGGTHPTKRLGPASARPATLLLGTAQLDGMGARVAVPVAGKWRMTEPLELWKIVLSLTSHVTPAHVEVAGPLRRKVAVPSGVLLKMLMSIA